MGNMSRTRDPNVCLTPGAQYGTTIKGHRIDLSIVLPRSVLTPNDKALEAKLHRAILGVMEDVYRDNWTAFAGANIDGGPLPSRWQDL